MQTKWQTVSFLPKSGWHAVTFLLLVLTNFFVSPFFSFSRPESDQLWFYFHFLSNKIFRVIYVPDLIRLVKDIIFNEINIPEKIAKKLPKIANNRQKSERSSIRCKSQLNTYLKRSVCNIPQDFTKTALVKSGKNRQNLPEVTSAAKIKLTLNSKNQLNTYLKKNLFAAFHKLLRFC